MDGLHCVKHFVADCQECRADEAEAELERVKGELVESQKAPCNDGPCDMGKYLCCKRCPSFSECEESCGGACFDVPQQVKSKLRNNLAASQQQVAEAQQIAETNAEAASTNHRRWLESQQRVADLEEKLMRGWKPDYMITKDELLAAQDKESQQRIQSLEQQNGKLRGALTNVSVSTDEETSWVHFKSGSKHASLNIGNPKSQIVVHAITGWVADRIAALSSPENHIGEATGMMAEKEGSK